MSKLILLTTVFFGMICHLHADLPKTIEFQLAKLDAIEREFAAPSADNYVLGQTLIFADLVVLATHARIPQLFSELTPASARRLNRHLVLAGPAILGVQGKIPAMDKAEKVLKEDQREALAKVFPVILRSLVKQETLLIHALVVGKEILTKKDKKEVASELGLEEGDAEKAHSEISFVRHLAKIGAIPKEAPIEHIMRALSIFAIAKALDAPVIPGNCAQSLKRPTPKALPTPRK